MRCGGHVVRKVHMANRLLGTSRTRPLFRQETFAPIALLSYWTRITHKGTALRWRWSGGRHSNAEMRSDPWRAWFTKGGAGTDGHALAPAGQEGAAVFRNCALS